mgnify:CR=1 FL=1
MKHYGDITKINGSLVEPVNVVIGGSPCQDLSVAGKQAGLAGERSGLFMEQLRIIKEMRRADLERGRTGKDTRPRYMVWENVPGAFSSNKGADFSIVLQETAKVACEQAPAVPIPKNGWPPAGCLTDMGGQWSIAWRVFDAQFWGVPQRRRRIALVADFGGLTAPKILFERESVSGHSETRGTPREGSATEAKASSRGNDNLLASKKRGCLTPCTLKIRSGCEGGGKGALIQEDKSATLSTSQDQILFQPMDVACRNGALSETSTPIQAAMGHTLTAASGMSGNNRPVICIQGNCIDRADTAGCNGKGWTEDVSYTLNTVDRPAVMQAIGSDLYNGNETGNTAPTLTAAYQVAADSSPAVVAIENHPNNSRIKLSEDNVIQTLSARMGTGGGNTPMILECYSQDANNDRLVAGIENQHYIVRNLTPLECERLQGFPDGWTDIGEWTDSKGKVHKESADSARYKALGNSIAIPPWTYVLQRLSLCCGAKPTMASLFDGIGGFPYIWESLNGKGSCVWASEIEDFPIAVTKYHFPEEVNNDG